MSALQVETVLKITAMVLILPLLIVALLLFVLYCRILDRHGKIKEPLNPFRDEWDRHEQASKCRTALAPDGCL